MVWLKALCFSEDRSYRALLLLPLALLMAACGGGSDSPSNDTGADDVQMVTIDGRVSYDLVPHQNSGALDYLSVSRVPAKGVTVQLVSDDNGVVGESITDVNGRYSVAVTANTRVRVRVLAELKREAESRWRFNVADNTRRNAQYVMEGQLQSSGSQDSSRDLHAPSGWGGSGYSGERVAAPFAILGSVFAGIEMLLDADAGLHFPDAQIRWSKDNIASPGAINEGLIGSSFYNPGDGNIYLLGHENNDTDEYDASVILHEFAHYVEDAFSRSESPGRQHDLRSALDMRLAWSEGFANAFSALASQSETYVDSSGPAQNFGFRYSLEENTLGNAGWFNENSLGKLVFDLADGGDESGDLLALGYGPVHEALVAPDYVGSPGFTSIFLFSEVLLESLNEEQGMQWQSMLDAEGVHSVAAFGEGETNNSAANISFALPVYRTLEVGDTINVCGNNRESEYNGLDVRRFVRLMVPDTDSYQLSFSKTLGTGDKFPAYDLFLQGRLVSEFVSGRADLSSVMLDLNAGEYALDVFEGLNVDGDEQTGGSACFDLSFTVASEGLAWKGHSPTLVGLEHRQHSPTEEMRVKPGANVSLSTPAAQPLFAHGGEISLPVQFHIPGLRAGDTFVVRLLDHSGLYLISPTQVWHDQLAIDLTFSAPNAGDYSLMFHVELSTGSGRQVRVVGLPLSVSVSQGARTDALAQPLPQHKRLPGEHKRGPYEKGLYEVAVDVSGVVVMSAEETVH